jgi:hypothetical protein
MRSRDGYGVKLVDLDKGIVCDAVLVIRTRLTKRGGTPDRRPRHLGPEPKRGLERFPRVYSTGAVDREGKTHEPNNRRPTRGEWEYNRKSLKDKYVLVFAQVGGMAQWNLVMNAKKVELLETTTEPVMQGDLILVRKKTAPLESQVGELTVVREAA